MPRDWKKMDMLGDLRTMYVFQDSAFLQSLNASWTGNICNENSTSWWGVACTFGHVTGLDLSGADVGAVPLPQIHLLEKLRSFKCVKCSFTGEYGLITCHVKVHFT